MQMRPLGRLINLIEASGYRVQHHYDDMVFVEHTAFFFRFDNDMVDRIHVHFNIECHQEAKDVIRESLMARAGDEDLELIVSDDFRFLEPDTANEKLKIAFLKS